MSRHIDYYFLTISAALLAFGLLFLATLSSIISLQTFGNTHYYIFHQLISVAIGLIAAAIAYKIPLHFLKRISPVLLILNALTLLAVFLPVVGTKLGGASRWINIGGLAFQPSEFFKVTAILYLSAWLSNKYSQQRKKGWTAGIQKNYQDTIKIYLPFLIFLAIIAVLLLLQRDLSTLGIISASLITVYFMAGTPFWQTLATLVSGAGAAILLILAKPYRFDRLLIFLHPETDPLGIGRQVKQSIIAIGSGGWFGKGLGMSTQKFGFLPEAMSDSMFAILGEETGIFGSIILISLFVGFIWLAFKIAKSATDTFSKLTAAGISTWIVFQAFINIASAIGLFPLSGIPLPFFSYGGSHVIAELIGVGLILNISRNG